MPCARSVLYSFFTAIGGTFLLFLFYAPLAIEAGKRGLALFSEAVFPSLFPFLVLSELFLSSGVGEIVGRLFSRPFKLIFGISANGSSALVLGVLCGQPVTACFANSLLEKEVISKKEAQRLCLFGNNPSAGFLIAMVGGKLFGNAGAGIALFFITLFSAAFLGLTLRLFFGKANEKQIKPCNGIKKKPFSAQLTSAIQRGFSSSLQIGAFLIFFSSLTGILAQILTSAQLDTKWHALLFGVLELTTGLNSATATLTAYSALRLTAFFCGFGGICVCMQILSIAHRCEISLWHYLLAKLLQGCFSLLLCEGYLRLFRPALSPAQSIPTGSLSEQIPILSVTLILLFAGILFKKRKEAQDHTHQA